MEHLANRLRRYSRLHQRAIFVFCIVIVVITLYQRPWLFVTRPMNGEEVDGNTVLSFPLHRGIVSLLAQDEKRSISLYHWREEYDRFETVEYVVIRNLAAGSSNKASLSNGECVSTNLLKNDVSLHQKVILVTNVVHYGDSKTNVTIYWGQKPTAEQIEARWMEVLGTLQSNLNHPQIGCVVVLVEVPDTAHRLERLDLQNSSKLIVVNRKITMGSMLDYATRCYRDKIVAISHMDNMFGDGWEKVNFKYMKMLRVMYALTRHSSTRGCYATRFAASCDKNHAYIGSHDTFVFHVKEPINENTLDIVGKSKPSNYGVENILMYAFEKKMNYYLLNPCPVLKIHHEHCIPLRDSRKRINNGVPSSGSVGFVDSLTY